MKNIYYILLGFIVIPCITHAQYTITGEVKGSVKSTAYIHSLNKKVATDSLGYFTMNDIPGGVFILEITSPGYQTELIPLSLPASANASTTNTAISIVPGGVTISIRPAPVTYVLNEVMVAGAKPSLQQTLPQPTEAVHINDMEERGQLTVMEAMASKPGISLITTGPGIARPVIRGLTGNRIITVINGVKLENQQWDLEHTLGMNQYGIDRIEIVKGPYSYLYGSDAMGGVLDFIDEKPAPVNRLTGNVSAGFNSSTFGTTTDAGVKGSRENHSWSLRAGLNNSSDYYDANFNRVANSRFREFLGKATYSLNYKKSTTLFSYQVNLGYYGIVEPFESDSGAEEEEDHPMEFENPYHTLLHQTCLIKNTLHLGRTKLITTVSYQNDQRKELEPGNTEDNPFLGFSLNVGSANIKAEHYFSDNFSVTAGSEGTLQHNSNTGYGRLIPDYDQMDIAFFGVSRLTLLRKRLNLDAGVRHDIRNLSSSLYGIQDSVDYMPALRKDFSNTSVSFGFNAFIVRNIRLYANVGTGFRAPNMAELTSNGIRLETQRYEVGNATFKKETNTQFDAGVIFGHKQFNVELSAFYNNIDQYIFIVPRGDSLANQPVYSFKQTNTWIYGMEGKVSVFPDAVKWLSFMGSLGALQGFQSGGDYLPMMPPYKLNTELTLTRKSFYSFQKTFMRLGIQYVWNQNRTAPSEIQTPGYSLVNLNWGGTISIYNYPVKVSMGVNNLFNAAYYDHLSRLRIYGVYALGINAFVTLSCPLDIPYRR